MFNYELVWYTFSNLFFSKGTKLLTKEFYSTFFPYFRLFALVRVEISQVKVYLSDPQSRLSRKRSFG